MSRAVEYTTIEQQIQSLRDKGLLFDNEERARLVLERYGYYNIINSYKEPYQHIVEDTRKYIVGTTFEQISSLFQTILFICLDYRNAAAHGGRIYNFQSSHARDVRISQETQSAKYVWVNEKTKRYHSTEFCSGMESGMKRKYEEIDTGIYCPCKRCIPENNRE